MIKAIVLGIPMVLAGCGSADKDSGAPAGLPAGAAGTGAGTGTGTGTGTGSTSCDLGLACNPIPITSFPTVDSRDTSLAPGSEVDSYACAPTTDESGPEWFYAVQVPSRGLLSVQLDDVSGDAVDVDIHLLQTTDPASCVKRDNVELGWVVDAGTVYLVADTWVNGSGVAQEGAYELTVNFFPLGGGPCAVETGDLRMFWDDCDPEIDCDVQTHTDGSDYPFVHLPSSGPLVKEAHLVTTDEDFPGTWPTSFTDEIDRHYTITEGVSGYAMDRSEPWAPNNEGGSMFGQGSTGAKVPPEHETWYVNMYWRDRPAPATRMILFNPITGAAVVAAAGYETGPGSNDAIGGATEEVHDVLGTVHRSDAVLGFAVDQTLPFGPISCF